MLPAPAGLVHRQVDAGIDAQYVVFDREAEGGFGGGGAVGDRVDDLAEGAVRAAQAFADEVAVPFQFLQAGADCLASV